MTHLHIADKTWAGVASGSLPKPLLCGTFRAFYAVGSDWDTHVREWPTHSHERTDWPQS